MARSCGYIDVAGEFRLGGVDQEASASDIAVQGVEVESIDFQLKWGEEVCLQHQEELEQMNQSGA